MSGYTDQIRNKILTGLAPDALAALMSRLKLVNLTHRQVLYHAEAKIDAVYFPESGMISLVSALADGTQAEVGVVGHEGVLGGSLASGVDTSFVEAMVPMEGTAWRLGAADFRDELGTNPALRALTLRHGDALLAQVMQTAACNGRHGIERRLARWLLMAHDRTGADELPLTQEFLAMMLGVARPSVTLVARGLQRKGLISYRLGRITIVDRAGLEAASCECYGAVRRRLSLLDEVPPASM